MVKTIKMKKTLTALALFVLLLQGGSVAARKVYSLTPTITWELEDKCHLIISGTGDIPDMPRDKYPWAKKAKDIVNITIGEGITRIGNDCFSNYGVKSNRRYSMLLKVTLPSTLKEIGERAFYENTPFQRVSDNLVQIPVGVTKIGKEAFYGCNIWKLQLPSTLTVIDEWVFAKNKICQLDMHMGLVEIRDNAFRAAFGDPYKNGGLKSLKLPATVTKVGENAFRYNMITTLECGNGVLEIGNYAFADNKLENVVFSSKLDRIGESATLRTSKYPRENGYFELKYTPRLAEI